MGRTHKIQLQVDLATSLDFGRGDLGPHLGPLEVVLNLRLQRELISVQKDRYGVDDVPVGSVLVERLGLRGITGVAVALVDGRKNAKLIALVEESYSEGVLAGGVLDCQLSSASTGNDPRYESTAQPFASGVDRRTKARPG